MAEKRFTEKQIRRMRKIEDFRVAKGLPGYEDAIEVLLAGLMERDGLGEDDFGESFNELLAACKFDENGMFETNWPLEPIEANEDEWEVVEHQFPHAIMIDQGLGQLQEMADRGEIRLLAGSRRALKWIAEHPNAQLDHPIILPIHRRFILNQTFIPVFEAGYPHRRIINFRLADTAALQNFRWLVLRKKVETVPAPDPVPVPAPTQESFDELLAACKFDENGMFETNWPFEPIEADEYDWEVVEHQFPSAIIIDQGIGQLQEMAARGEIRLLTGSRRALKWIAEHPNTQLDHQIILPIPIGVLNNQMIVPVFEAGSFPRRRTINFRLTDTGVLQHFRWLVLRKKAETVQARTPVPTLESFDDLLAACRQDYIAPNFTEESFPFEPILPNGDDWEVVEQKLPLSLDLAQSLKDLVKMEDNGEIRLLTGSRRALKWIAEHPDAQRNHQIVLWIKDNDYLSVPIFSCPEGKRVRRQLGLYHPDTRSLPSFRWLVLRKKAEAVQAPGPIPAPVPTPTPPQESFVELLAACKQDIVTPDFTEDQWPLEPIDADEDEWEMVEYNFEGGSIADSINSFVNIAGRGKIRFRNILRRALKWIAEHPDAQLDHPVVIPIYYHTGDGAFVPIFKSLAGDGKIRMLGLHEAVRNNTEKYSILALRRR